MKVISFGDSFTAGLGADRLVEDAIYSSYPKEDIQLARLDHRKFIRENSFTKFFADRIGVPYENYGEIGCSNKDILNNVLEKYMSGDIEKGDLVLVAFTSTLRDELNFLPDIISKNAHAGVTWSIKEIALLSNFDDTFEQYKQTDKNILPKLPQSDRAKTLSYLTESFFKVFIDEMFTEEYLDFFNANMVVFLQMFFELIEVDYIFIDAFESTHNQSSYDRSHMIKKEHYWKFGEHSIYSYLCTFNDRDLLELDGYNINNIVPKHPSRKGHKEFSNSLYYFYINKKNKEGFDKLQTKTNKRYYFNTFEHLNSFDIIPAQEVVDMYLRNHKLLEEEKYEKNGGETERPINSDNEEIKEGEFWNGYEPSYYIVDPFRKYANLRGKPAVSKADIISMDLKGLGKKWTHFVYLEIPKQLFLEHQIKVFANPDISIFKEFLREVESKHHTFEELIDLIDSYDKKYPETHTIRNHFREDVNPAWRADLEPGQYLSMRNDGLIYPICYNSTCRVLDRGSHRALFHAMLGFDVPIFVEYPITEEGELQTEWIVEVGEFFDKENVTLHIDVENKQLEFYSNGEKFL